MTGRKRLCKNYIHYLNTLATNEMGLAGSALIHRDISLLPP